MVCFDPNKLFKQLVEFSVADLRLGIDVVEVVVAVDEPAQFFSTF